MVLPLTPVFSLLLLSVVVVLVSSALGVGTGKIKNKNDVLETVRTSFELDFGSNDIYAAS